MSFLCFRRKGPAVSLFFLFVFMLPVSVFCQLGLHYKVDQKNQVQIFFAGKHRLLDGKAHFADSNQHPNFVMTEKNKGDVLILSLISASNQQIGENERAGIFFEMPGTYKQGIALWRYKPWNSWSKPLQIQTTGDLPEWDVQFYYWQYNDGIYGAAVPLSGFGFRTTIGSSANTWGSVATLNSKSSEVNKIPALAIGFGKDPYELFARVYREALVEMGFEQNQRRLKTFPEPLNYIGWCTWNSSDQGKNLNESLLLTAAKSFQDHSFPLGWILIDDGWFKNAGGMLQSMKPDSVKFPHQFKPIVTELKHRFGLKYVGVWHALNGYWNGIDTASGLGLEYRGRLFSWHQKENVNDTGSEDKTYFFIKPENSWIGQFYQEWHKYLKDQGFDFLKVDNQLVVERMAKSNFPIMDFADSIHRSLNASVSRNFDRSLINCMDMTADAYLNFGRMAVARCSEDYFPFEPKENYNLQHGNAAAHVLQAIYNSIYFGQMVYPDFDMFQSHNPNASFHAIARAINNGPVYITDDIGKQRFDVLWPLVYHDGRIIHSESNLVPTADCLFQLQGHSIFKAFSTTRAGGLLGIWNMADTSVVSGRFGPADIPGGKASKYALYDYFSGKFMLADSTTFFPLTLERLQYKLFYVVPVQRQFAAFGLVNKYNGPATVLEEKWGKEMVSLKFYEGGLFKAYSRRRPRSIDINGKKAAFFTYENQLLIVHIPGEKPVTVQLHW